jgi:hypothetical protein
MTRKLIAALTITLQNMAFTITVCRWFQLLAPKPQGVKDRRGALMILLLVAQVAMIVAIFHLSFGFYNREATYTDNTWIDSLMTANIENFLQALINAVFIYCHFNIYRRLRNNLTNFLLRNEGIFNEEQK